MRYRPILLLLLLLWGPVAGIAVNAGSGQGAAIANVRAYLDTLAQEGFSGAVLIECQGKIVLQKGYGYSDVQHKRKNSTQTIFDIGSITKQFTAAAIMRLEMEGKLSTEDKLSKYFANVPADKSEITIHQLLRHSAGLTGSVGRDYEKTTQADFVDTVMRSPLKFAPGTAFSYSNIGYSLLGIIIEKVSGMSYEEFLYQKLWHPAGMEQTGYTRPHFSADRIATGYDNDERAWGKPTEKQWDTDGPFWHLKGNGGVLSTAEDMFRWHQTLLGDQVLSREAVKKMYHPKLREGEDSANYYAYGWDVHRTPRNTTVYWHNGTNGIFFADFYRFIDEGTTVIVLTNRSNGLQEAGGEIGRLLLSPDYKPVMPVADNRENRAFTDHVIAVTLQLGAEVGAKELTKSDPHRRLLEERVNRKGYDLLQAGRMKEAVSVFRLNVEAFPQSANAFDSLGEAYLAAGETTLAKENYEKSLALDSGNKNAEKILQRLQEK